MCEDDEGNADEFSIKIPAEKKDEGKKDNRVDGYIIDYKAKIVGEARRYDPYSHYGEILFYEVDTFGFISGYLKDNWTVMSKEDLLQDKMLRKELKRVEYEDWKKHNVPEMKERWENYGWKRDEEFEDFCKRIYKRIKKNNFKPS